MSYPTSRRRTRALAVGTTALAAATWAVAPSTAAQAAALPGTLTVTAPANGKLAALTAKQVVVLTVSGTGAPKLSEDNVASVDLGAGVCMGLTNYVVTSPTTITIKTPAAIAPATVDGCPVGSGNVTINFSSPASGTLSTTKPLNFVAPPTVAAPGTTILPIATENSAGLPIADQNSRFLATGGQIVRVTAGQTGGTAPNTPYAFDPRKDAGLKVSMGGKDGADIKVYTPAGVLMSPTTTTDADVTAAVGNYLTFKTVTGMNPATDSVTITQNSVSKTFGATPTELGTAFDVATGPLVTAVSPAFGRITGGQDITVTASGLSKSAVPADYEVDFCGSVPGTVVKINSTTTAATSLTVTTPTTLGAATSPFYPLAGACSVTIKTTTPAYTSPVTAAGIFTFLKE